MEQAEDDADVPVDSSDDEAGMRTVQSSVGTSAETATTRYMVHAGAGKACGRGVGRMDAVGRLRACT